MSSAPTLITHEGGLKFAAHVGKHRIVVDQPHRAGGEDTGPAPIELLGVALGTCVAFYVHQFCHARRLPCTGLRVEVDQLGAVNPSRIGGFSVRVIMPSELPEHYAAILERVARSCPAHNTLSLGAEVNIQIEIPAVAAATLPPS